MRYRDEVSSRCAGHKLVRLAVKVLPNSKDKVLSSSRGQVPLGKVEAQIAAGANTRKARPGKAKPGQGKSQARPGLGRPGQAGLDITTYVTIT